MSKTKILSGAITHIKGAAYYVGNHMVVSRIGAKNVVGDVIQYAATYSIKNVRVSAGRSQWVEQRTDYSNVFFKQI